MNVQQIIAWILVGLAAAFLLRLFVGSLRAFLSGKGGCGDGCGKCSFAPKDPLPGKKAASQSRPDIIPLTDIRTLSRKE
ncbi:MAG TPA: hypothetical protein VFA07_06600 [Chthonomonadaceae bacterium]|nr:hypothetical protein [Chthonomonadaceae bacterium]